MEQNLPVIAKKFWNIVRVAYFMLRKSISKRKLMLDLNLIMKRGKIASKAAIQNLMLHHTHQWSNTQRRSHDKSLPFSPPHNYNNNNNDYEFSCSNSPVHDYPNFHLPFNKRNKNKYCSDNGNYISTEDDVVVVNAAVMKALEMIQSETASPALPGFGRTPMVRQLRITDSPFPLRDVEDNSHVDEAAEAFISKFYRNLRRQASPCA
ncbi:PREDICTED: uncharacterized protein LOC109220110 [Nicotiana attenuata]|uniref:Avr9/Cf-9 rapidly elicited protein 146 n=1 Tax=Nicotiana attenuata TaxID=49451 RepID=A0A1J6JVI1_NICAT|nr:PREDICTED: uncharacterized protein LOC109220110 [Nicotiana attenuata]OIT20476.1 hypothetical protein A4A49_37718 [Nicotiana attenuata]